MRDVVNVYKDYLKTISKNVVLFLGIIFFATIVTSAYNVLFGIYMKNLGFNEEVVGRIMSLRTLGVAIGAVPVAIFAERFNKKKTIIMGLAFMVIGSLVTLNVRNLLVMEVFSLIFGVGNATLMILQAPIIYDNTDPEHRVTAFSLAFVFQNIAFVLGSFVLGHLSQIISTNTSETYGNSVVLNGATMLVFIAIYIALKLDGEQMTTQDRIGTVFASFNKTINGYRKLLKGKTLMYLSQVALVGLGAGMIVPFFSMYLKYTLTVDDGVVGTIMAISQVGTVIGGLIVPPLAKKIGSVNTVIACQLLSIPFLISISLPQGIIIITMSFFFRSSLMNMANPIIGSLAMEITSDETRTYMSSMISMVNNLFRSVGIYIGGFLMFNYSYNTPYYWTIFCYLIGTVIIYSVFKVKRINKQMN